MTKVVCHSKFVSLLKFFFHPDAEGNFSALQLSNKLLIFGGEIASVLGVSNVGTQP